MPLRGWSGWVRYGLPSLVLGFVLTWAIEGRGPSAFGQSQALNKLPLPSSERSRTGAPVVPTASQGGESAGTIAFTSSTGGTAQLLTLIDTKSRAFAVYRIDPANPKGLVKLEAVRQYQWDLKLSEYNNLPPEVASIEATVKSLGQPNR